jgi:MraZ protein
MDAKGRMAMPTKYRDALNSAESGQLIATVDVESDCLLIYPLSVWENLEQQLQKLPSANKKARRLKRMMLGHASELELDANGRVLLPVMLREHANLEKKLVLAGQGEKFELWSESGWMAETQLAIADAREGELDLPAELQDLVF